MPTRRRANSDSQLVVPITAPAVAFHISDAFQAFQTDLYPARVGSVRRPTCLQFEPDDAEYYQGLLAECERYAGLVAETGLGEPILPTKSGGGGIMYTLPTLVGHRTQAHYLHAIRLILSLRQDLRLQSMGKAFWKEKARVLDPNLDTVTPSASDLNLSDTESRVHTHESTSTLRQSTYFLRNSVRHSQHLVTPNPRFSFASDSNESFHTVAEEPVISREASFKQLSPILEVFESSLFSETSSLTASLERICALLDSSAECTLVNDMTWFPSFKSLSPSAESSTDTDTDFSWEAEEEESSIAPEFLNPWSLEEFLSPRNLSPASSMIFADLPCSTPPKKPRLQVSGMFEKARSASSASIKSLRLARRS